MRKHIKQLNNKQWSEEINTGGGEEYPSLIGMNVILENGQRRIYGYLNKDMNSMGKDIFGKEAKNTKTLR